MRLEELIRGLETVMVKGDTGIEITSVTSDSRSVADGSLFVALTGSRSDGHRFIADAVRKGAIAYVAERDTMTDEDDVAAAVIVKDSRDALALVASRFYGVPSQYMHLIGITGTNGKTTTSYLLKRILEVWGKETGLTGTIRYMIGTRIMDASHTTPGPVEFQQILSEMKDAGCSYVVSEVSSHALDQKRVDHTRFMTAIFTNLSRDHLDYHGSMEEYFSCKKRLFTDLLDHGGTAVINTDDEYGTRLMNTVDRRVVTYGLGRDAEVGAGDIKQNFKGLRFSLRYMGREYSVRTPLIGMPNVYNILAAAATALSLSVPVEVVQEALCDVPGVDGRFETFSTVDGVLVVVDYAHTPDALQKLLQTVRGLDHNRIITVFGCGGDRDRGKRPMMGRIAEKGSDYVILTSDNPRFEDEGAIIRDIAGGMEGTAFETVRDREKAVTRALEIAEEGDVVVIAGKGHEDYQEIRGIRYPMRDQDLVARALRALGRE